MSDIVILAAVVMACALVTSAVLIVRQLRPALPKVPIAGFIQEDRPGAEIEKALTELRAKVTELESRQAVRSTPTPEERYAAIRQEVSRLTAAGLDAAQIRQAVAAQPAAIDLLIRVNNLCGAALAEPASPGSTGRPAVLAGGLRNSPSTALAELR
jgi:hypothetical protein